MVSLDAARSAITSSYSSRPIVAVFVGGTSGICHYTLRALVESRKDDGKDLRIYMVGRNQAAADRIMGESRASKASLQISFVKADDLSLLKDVDLVCDEIKKAEGESGRIDLLVMSQGGLILGGRQDTSEGLALTMALQYYSRVRFADRLLPLLLRTSPSPAHIISIYAGGMEQTLFADDLSLRKPGNFSFANARSHVVYMKTLFFEELARRHPGRLSLVHLFPGLVITPAFYDNGSFPWWFRLGCTVAGPLARRIATPEREAGERVLFLGTERFAALSAEEQKENGGEIEKAATGLDVAVASDGQRGGGAYVCSIDGETVPYQKHVKKYKGMDREKFTKQVWTHTTKAFDEIEAGRVFTD